MNEAERILREQELKELKLRRLETLKAAAKWREEHKLELIQPHAQQQRLIDAYLSRKHSIHAVLGGNRCLSPDEPIFNPLTGESVPVSKIPGTHHVLAWDENEGQLVVAEATTPFLKGRAPMVRVRLSNGQEFRVSQAHRVLCADNVYRAVGELKPGCELFLLPTSAGIYPLVHDADDPSSSRTAQDSQDDCPQGRHLCDEPLPRVQEVGQVSAPSQAGVQQRICRPEHPSSERSDATGHRQGYNHACPQPDLLSTRGAHYQSEDQCAEFGAECRCHGTLLSSARLDSTNTPTPPQSSIAAFPQTGRPSVLRPVHRSTRTLQAYQTSVSITSILPDGEDDVWDFTVPYYHNYYHKSTIHHNSGKSFIGAALTVAIALGRLPWVPIPTPMPLPQPYGSKVLADGTIGIIFPEQVINTLPESERPAWQPHVTERPDPAFTIGAKKTSTSPAKLLIRMFESDKAYRAWRASIETPADPGQLRFKPPVKIRVFGEDAKALEQVQIPLIRSLIAPEWIAATKKNSFGLDGHWLLNNGSTIDFFTYQQEPATFEGWHGHHLWFDEPPPRPVYIANLRGLVDFQGTSLFTMTPLKEAWIADEVVNKPDQKIFSMVMNSRENPHVSKEAIDQFEEALTEEERETRIGGKFLHLQGLVFKDFDPRTHVVDPFVPDRSYTVYVAIDTHPRTEQAVIFAAVDRHERVYIVHEIFKHGTPEQVSGWIADFHRNVHPIQAALIDPSSQADQNRGDSTYSIIAHALHVEGIPLDFGSKDLAGGLQIMQTYFKSRNGQASLFYCRDCTRSIWELQRYVWNDWRGSTAQEKNQLNKPRDKDDHLIENTRRILQLPPRWYSPHGAPQTRGGYVPIDPIAGY